MIRVSALLAFTMLAGCGVDGPPEPVTSNGLILDGEARAGLVARF